MNTTKVYLLERTDMMSLRCNPVPVKIYLSKREAEFAQYSLETKNRKDRNESLLMVVCYYSIRELEVGTIELNGKEYQSFITKHVDELTASKKKLLESTENNNEKIKAIDLEIASYQTR